MFAKGPFTGGAPAIFVPRFNTGDRAAGGGGVAFTTVDMLYRADVGLEGVNPSVANLNDGTFGLATGSWSKVGAATNYQWTEDDIAVPGLGLAGGSGSGDPLLGSIGWNLSAVPSAAYALFTFGSSKATLCLGFAWKVSTFSAEFDTYNPVRIDTGGGNFFTATVELNNEDLRMFAHAGTANGAAITGLQENVWYWTAMKLDNTANARLRVYRISDWVQMTGGTSESVATRSGTDAATAVRCLGLTDVTGATTAGSTIIQQDDIAMRFADVHPLLPAP